MAKASTCPDCGAEAGRLHEPHCLRLPGVPVGATFEELGIPFPLFEDAVEGTEFCGLATCSLCRRSSQLCFEVDAILSTCEACRADNAIDPKGPEDRMCRSCHAPISGPPVGRSGTYRACYDCLRGGRGVISKDTEFGLISWDETLDGLTAGVPASGLVADGFDVVPTECAEDDDEEDEFVRVRLPRESMFELLRTPTYSTWQGERWLFCCRRPMVFVGNWSEETYAPMAADGNTERLFNEIMKESSPEDLDLWGSAAAGNVSVYLFRCPVCGRYRGHWDCD